MNGLLSYSSASPSPPTQVFHARYLQALYPCSGVPLFPARAQRCHRNKTDLGWGFYSMEARKCGRLQPWHRPAVKTAADTPLLSSQSPAGGPRCGCRGWLAAWLCPLGPAKHQLLPPRCWLRAGLCATGDLAGYCRVTPGWPWQSPSRPPASLSPPPVCSAVARELF